MLKILSKQELPNGKIEVTLENEMPYLFTKLVVENGSDEELISYANAELTKLVNPAGAITALEIMIKEAKSEMEQIKTETQLLVAEALETLMTSVGTDLGGE